jgi:recombination protein RecT
LDALHDSTTFKYVYAYATLKNGQTQFVVLSKADIEKIQALSRFNNELYFNDKKDPNMWMIRKCAVVQLSKVLPKDYYGNRVLEIETRTEGGAVLILDEDNQVIIENKKGINKGSPGIKTFNSLPDLPEEYNN